MRFQTPLISLLLIVFALFCIRPFRRFYARARLSLSLGPYGGEPFSLSQRKSFLARLPLFFEVLAVLLLLLAAASPVRLDWHRVYLDRGSDIAFALDLSPSMSARDGGGPRRFDLAKEVLRSFSSAHPSASLALVVFGKRAALACPPTLDRAAFLGSLETLQIGDYGDGTALGSGIMTAVLHLRTSSAPIRTIVLLTDGENNAGEIHPLSAARIAREAGMTLSVVGIGAEGSAYLDYEDPLTKERRQGTFVSQYDEASLAAIAQEGGGSWYRAEDEEALLKVFDAVSQKAVGLGRSRETHSLIPLYRRPLGISLALFFLATLWRRLFLRRKV